MGQAQRGNGFNLMIVLDAIIEWKVNVGVPEAGEAEVNIVKRAPPFEDATTMWDEVSKENLQLDRQMKKVNAQ